MAAEIIVQGVCEVHVMPDHASVRVDIDGDGGSREDAYKAANELAGAVDGALEARRAALGRVTTAALVVQPKTRWRKGESVRTGWRASRTTLVEITALGEVGAMLAELVQAGAAVHGPWWRVAPDNPAHDEVRTAAATDARRRAEAYATGLGLIVGDVAWVSEPGLRRGSDVPDQWRGGAMAHLSATRGGAVEEEPIAVSPEEITLEGAVEVGFAFGPRPAG